MLSQDFKDNILKYDVHCHIIPGVDDGARDFCEALELIESAYLQGIRVFYATPHYSRHQNAETIRKLYNQLIDTLKIEKPEIADNLEIRLGNELYYHSELAERLDEGQALTMGDSRYILIEFDPAIGYSELYLQLREIINAGYKPIIAHMERYAVLESYDNIGELKRLGCCMQMNYESLTGNGILTDLFNREVRRCRKLVAEGYIDLFGTDMHRRDFRFPNILKALEWIKKTNEQ
ncbi:MAG: protein tyrosine phosphatase [Lachnospiraceae bacterium]|nr:protein tyrosine phosphatase [Lachnospiraceae bacterium]